MINQQATTDEFATLLEQHIEEIAASWVEKTSHHASLQPSESWLDSPRTSTTRALRAMIDALRTGSYTALKEYLTDLSQACLRSGLENGEVTESLLLCKDAILSVIRRYSFDLDVVWAMISELDACLRWMVGNLNTLYTAEINRHLREQHEHIVSMLKIDVRDPDSVDIDEVLRQVAEGIMAAVEADHCDFYLMDENQSRLIPKWGTRRSPPSPEMAQHFLSKPIDLTTDVFCRELLERKGPSFSYDAQSDPRLNKEIVGAIGAKTVLVVPLVANDRVLGMAVTGTFDDYRMFTEGQIELAWDVARAATLVIEYAQLRQQARYMAALDERERLSREIHDNLAQALSVLKLQASHIEDLLQSNQNEQAQVFAIGMKKTASEACIDAREAIFSLRHSASSYADFLLMLQARLDRSREVYGMDARLVIQDESLISLPTATVIQLTRIIQEALANVHKHAKANTVSVHLARSDDHLVVTVEDDGQGFDSTAILAQQYGGVGLKIMRERAESVGGLLEVDTRPGQGTRILVRVPVSDRR